MLGQGQSFNRAIFWGMAFIALAGVWRTIGLHTHLLAENIQDGGMGLFYGLGFGLTILGIRRNAKARSSCRP